MKKMLKWGASALLMGVLVMPSFVFATDNPFSVAKNQVNTVQNSAGVEDSKSLPEMIGSIINIVLSFVGILLLAFTLYAGFLWMTAGGETKNVEKAQTMLKNAIIGLLIVIASFAISNYVLQSLLNVTKSS